MTTGLSLPWKRALGAAALFSIPLLLFGFFLLLQSEFRDAKTMREAAEQSADTRVELLRLMSLHQNVETGQRGYNMTGKAAFLEPYRDARSQIPASFAALDRLAMTDPDLRAELGELRALSRERLEFSERAVALTRQGSGAEAVALVSSGRGKAIMDAIRAEVDRLDALEAADLAVAVENREMSRIRVQRTINLVLAALALLLALIAAFTGHTIRARQQALARETALNARQQAIFDGAVDGMLVLDEDGYVREMNPSITRLFGLQPADLIGRHNTVLMADPPSLADSQAWLRMVGAAGSRGAGERREFQGKRADGSRLETDVAISRVGGDGAREYIAVIRDITERKRVEDMKTEFVSTVSHELRTPLTSIGGSLGLLAAGAVGPLNEKAARLVNIAHGNCERLIRLINDILDIEKIESGKMQFDLRRMMLGPLVDRTAAANRGFADKHGVTVETQLPPWPIAVMGDPDRLEQLLTNLVSNAIKHSPEGGVVEIGIGNAGQRARIEVRDRGAGVPEAFRGRIFGKFAMADQSDSRARGGTGLGLAIAREITERHGGTVGFEDRTGGGTVFFVELPMAECEERIASAADDGLPRLLHLDDDSDCLSVVESAFAGRANVVSVSSMHDARAELAQRPFAGVLVDVVVPPDNGLDLVPCLRQSFPGLPIVVFSALDDVEKTDDVDAVLTKSRSSIETLVETTMALVARGRREAA
ncbi:CHASE3 domain-containing protein [Tsuneonella amylolytica]|uniref:CHASE3 domain-containing protein n=1 Tax=Tsuneonella amylolytica TaxID=2338327 RepID=UPI000EA89D0B|nr:CHASE3 domain-containing protein [Tsuneonella amylolytica]